MRYERMKTHSAQRWAHLRRQLQAVSRGGNGDNLRAKVHAQAWVVMWLGERLAGYGPAWIAMARKGIGPWDLRGMIERMGELTKVDNGAGRAGFGESHHLESEFKNALTIQGC